VQPNLEGHSTKVSGIDACETRPRSSSHRQSQQILLELNGVTDAGSSEEDVHDVEPLYYLHRSHRSIKERCITGRGFRFDDRIVIIPRSKLPCGDHIACLMVYGLSTLHFFKISDIPVSNFRKVRVSD
jgi:hypothetical protein